MKNFKNCNNQSFEPVNENRLYVFSTSEIKKIKEDIAEIAITKKYTKGPLPYGYCVNPETNELEIDPIESQAIRYIFQSKISGNTYDYTCKVLNISGFRTKSGKLFEWHSLRNILKNKKYIGLFNYRIKYGKKGKCIISFRDDNLRIIDDETFYKVQKILWDRSRGKTSC